MDAVTVSAYSIRIVVHPLNSPEYKTSVIKQFPKTERDKYLQWIFANVPESRWRYTVYYIDVNTEAIQVWFNDTELATVFELRF